MLGYYGTKAALDAAQKATAAAGDAYGVGTAEPYDIYIFDGITGEFINNGPLQGAKGDTGPEGPQGPKGDPGETGPQGPAGADGAPGKDGAKGADGLPGKDGADGAPGKDGTNGRDGVTFTPSMSDDGDLSWTNDGGKANPQTVNLKGPKGDTGARGPAGTDGAKGDTGPEGPRGPQGEQGPQGKTGPQGETGPQGLTGPQGPAGADGAKGATFTPAVSAAGDLSWTNDGGLANPATVNIKGPKGDQGERGEKGDTGATGPQGPAGPVNVPSTTSLLKGNGSGGIVAATRGSDYATPPVARKVTLTVAGWNSSTKQQTVTCTGVLADVTKQDIHPRPVDTSYDNAWKTYGIKCIKQAANSLTFQCNKIPTSAVDIYVTITNLNFLS